MTAWRAAASMTMAALACVLVCTSGSASLAAAEGGAKLLESCHRGKLEVCYGMLARPRLAAGTRAAIELYLEDIEVQRKACAAGDANVCATLMRQHPDLPKQ